VILLISASWVARIYRHEPPAPNSLPLLIRQWPPPQGPRLLIPTLALELGWGRHKHSVHNSDQTFLLF
jgi:hypothetical protein